MAATSIHIKACDISASETHNRREKDLDYVRKELTHLNESFSYIPHSLPSELINIKREVKDKTGRKLQKNAIPIKEGVIVIDNKTTMADLRHFCEECQNKFGIIPLQIHIHRDEGHVRSKSWKPNLHAHIVWRMYNHDGRNVRLSKQECSEMQTLAAACLSMERGVSSSKKHLSSLQFKVEQQEKQIESLDSSLTLKAEGVVKGTAQGVADWITRRSKKRADKAEEEMRKDKATYNAKIKEAWSIVEKAQIAENNANKRISEVNQWQMSKQAELSQIEDFKKRTIKAEKELQELKDSISWKERWIEKFVEFGVTLREQWNKLFNGESVQSNHVRINGVICPLDNPISIRKAKFGRVEIHDQHWVSEEGFWVGIRKGLTDAFDRGSQSYAWIRQQLGGGQGMRL